MSAILRVGYELEGWFRSPWSEQAAPLWGKIIEDVGKNQREIVGNPGFIVKEALDYVRHLAASHPEAVYSAWRPPEVAGAGQWLTAEKPRVEAMYQALATESGINFPRIRNMTEAAAWHTTVSLHTDYTGALYFLRDVFENIGPYYAAQVHKERNDGLGHLAIWRGFADERRFPQYRWLPRRVEYQTYFESIPRLVGKEKAQFVPLPGGHQCMFNQLDHGFSWWLSRLKPLSKKRFLLEVERFLPSMPIDDFESHAHRIYQACELLVEWYFGINQGLPVMSPEAAEPAVALLHQRWHRYFPDRPLSQREWSEHFYM